MKKEKILIIDDEAQLVDMFKMRLEANNYDVIAAYDGEEGLDKAQKENPDIILLDIQMPRMDGYQTLKKLREDSRTESIPVIMLTAKSQAVDVSQAAGLGANDYIVKPFDPQTLMQKIKEHIKK